MKKRFLAQELTTANLGNAGVYTSGVFDLNTYDDPTKGFPYTQISAFAFANQASASNGFTIQFSNDGTNFYTAARASVTASVPSVLTVNIVARYFRVVYTNGASTTTTLVINVNIL